MKNCIYRTLLAEAFERKPLLCASPSAFYGTVLHKMLELISTGRIKTTEAFDEAFEGEVRMMELRLIEEGNSFLTPLSYRVKDFTLKKILVKKHLSSGIGKCEEHRSVDFISEKWLESKDGTVGGKVDLIIERDGETEIVDFKTGAVMNVTISEGSAPQVEVKTEYIDQLRLYAYLYFEQKGRYPDKLSLVDLHKKKYELDFSPQECVTIFEETKALLQAANESVENGNFSANPTTKNCQYCGYRPACKFYLESKGNAVDLGDVSGRISKVTAFRKGQVSVQLETDGGMLTISDFPEHRFQEFDTNVGKMINIFNLKKTFMPNFFSAIRTTMVYEQP
ncbi:PD-(D/E)XK nuclease superfamily protein [Pedobacter sp. ok626]|nr:PD-(D/E)XK nuclease superfamily protein [Pedobacter sp. ok626]